MELKGKTKIGMLLLNKKGKLEIVEPDRFYDGKGIPDVITQRWLEDEKGQKQAVHQKFGFSMQQEQPNQNQVSALDGHPVYTYLKMETSYLDGKKNGSSTLYHPNGNVAKISSYIDDKLNGSEIEYNTDGRLSSIKHWKDGKPDGLHTTYTYEGGVQHPYYSFWKDGKVIKTNAEIKREWGEIVEGLKYEKEVDKGARQSTLKALLKVSSREEKLDILDKFHSEKASVPRRTSASIERAITLNKLKGGPDMDI